MNRIRYFGSTLKIAPQFARNLSSNNSKEKSSARDLELFLKWTNDNKGPTALIIAVIGVAVWRLSDPERGDVEVTREGIKAKEKSRHQTDREESRGSLRPK